MKMLGIFCSSNITTNDELRRQLKIKNVILAILAAAGIIMIVAAVLYSRNGGTFSGDMPDEYYSGFYRGAGTGLIFAAVVMIARNAAAMKNEQKLTQMRIELTDERNRAINEAAMKISIGIHLAVMLLTIFVSGIYAVPTAKALCFMFVLFLFSYIISYSVLSTRM